MQAALYPNTVTSVNSSLAQNQIDFPPLAQQIITNAVIRQLSLCQLGSQALRLVLTVLSQTIGFNKKEDDMNGARLQQLTRIRADHANNTVRFLAQKHILIQRQGHYGHYLSLNFNFAQWGKDTLSEPLVSDPMPLLPEFFHQASDDGFSFGDSLDDSYDASISLFPPESGDTIDNEDNIIKDTTTAATATLRYPEQLSATQTQSIMNLVQQAGDKAQTLLDILAKRLKNTRLPLKSPVAYFTSLIKRLSQGTLDLNLAKTPKKPAKPKKKTSQTAAEKKRKSVLFNYHYFYQQISDTAKQHKISFDEALKMNNFDIHWAGVLQKMQDLNIALPENHPC